MPEQNYQLTPDRMWCPVEPVTEAHLMLKPGTERCFDIKIQRNPRFNRLAHAWLTKIFDNQDVYSNREQFRYAITIQAGYVETTIVVDDTVVMVPKSLKFSEMDESEFHAWQRAVDQVAQERYGVDIPMWEHFG